MIEAIPPELTGAGGIGVIWAGWALLRKVGLKASEDLTTLKGDAAERSTIDMLMKRIDRMDMRIESLEASRNRLQGFMTRCMAYVSRCDCEEERAVLERKILEQEYLEILKDSAK